MAAIPSSQFASITDNRLDGMIAKVLTGSTVAALHGREPMKFGVGEIVTFTELPKAEFVAEGQQKSPTSAAFGTVQTTPHKAQVTMRFNEEVKWADEDHQIGVLTALAEAGAIALARALDLGLYYRINPLSGTETAWPVYLNQTTLRVEQATAARDVDLESAVGLVLGAGYNVTGQAFDPTFSYGLATSRYDDGRKVYPELGVGQNLTAFNGLPAAVSNTVSARPETAGNKVAAIVGDYATRLRWGIQRELPVHTIEYGDPDGLGDLKRFNQIALRLEVLYAWWVDPAAFAVIEDAAA